LSQIILKVLREAGSVPTGPTDAKPKSGENGFADIILSLNTQCQAGEAVTLGDALDHAGARMHGAAILLLALPEALPLPIPSFGAILGVPLLMTSAHLALFGERGNLPARARQIRLPQRMLALMTRYFVGPMRRAERLSQDRLSALAGRERLVGVVCIALSSLLLLPIPLMNVPPALALVILSWGLVQRDGLFVGLGLAIAAAIMISIVAMTNVVLDALN
jgi:hypothetical protein